MSPRESTHMPCGPMNAVGPRPAWASPNRASSLPWWSTMLTRGPKFGLLRLTAIAGEYLHAVVLAVGDIDPAVGVGANVVHDVEFSRAGARSAPGHQQFAVGRIFVHLGVAVTVGDVNFAVRREGRVGA